MQQPKNAQENTCDNFYHLKIESSILNNFLKFTFWSDLCLHFISHPGAIHKQVKFTEVLFQTPAATCLLISQFPHFVLQIFLNSPLRDLPLDLFFRGIMPWWREQNSLLTRSHPNRGWRWLDFGSSEVISLYDCMQIIPFSLCLNPSYTV